MRGGALTLQSLRVGDQLEGGRIVIGPLLGAGGMGQVYRAYDRRLERDVALKAMTELAPDDLYRLKREFRVLAGFSHPNLVQLYELFAGDRHCFFTMELLEGEPLMSHVRGATPAGARLDPDALVRLRRAFAQLTTALRVLHEAGQVHRDVKPSNVIVMPEARAVLLDFGLATLGREGFESEDWGFVGTLPYVASEQAWGREPSPAADWYSLGATLYEVLTGRTPFIGPVAEVIRAKEQDPPPNPGTRADGVPEELAALVVTLLHPDPARRPGPDRVLEVLSQLPAPETARRGDAFQIPFVGRRSEWARLAQLLERSRAAPVVTYVRGSSGIGKSELVYRFACHSRDSGALVLTGRCRPQESVSYRALDPLMDELSRHLVKLPDAEAAEFVPRFADALLRVFPVMARVPALAKAPDSGAASDDEVVRRGFLALRDLLARLADRRPLIVWIDDAQWGDRGSIAPLRSALRPPDAPRLLLVLSYRSEDAESSTLLQGLRQAGEEEGVAQETLPVAPLSEGESRELVESLTASEPALDDRDTRAVIADSAGSPFFLIELVRHLTRRRDRSGREPSERPSVERILSERLQHLPGDARAVLDVVAVAGRPVSASFALGLAGLGPRGRPRVLDLCAQLLLRTGGSEELDEIETYHDRIRETVLLGLDAAERRARHRQLAEGLRATSTPDPAAVVEHFLGAGEEALAAEYAIEAAATASAALAFDRAAEFYALADRLRGERDGDFELRVRRADALATAGRGAEAGDAYVAGAEALARFAPHERRQALLVRRAAEQYLYAGHTQAGLERTREVMRQLGIPIPRSPAAAARAANLSRLRFLLLQPQVRTRPSEETPQEQRDRLDALFGIAKGTSILSAKLSDYLGMSYLREALAAGDAGHIARALAKEASIEGALPGNWWRRRGGRLLARAGEIAASSGIPDVLGTVHTCWGSYYYFGSRWRPALENCERAVEIFRTCVGERESLTMANTFLVAALAQLGELRRMSRLLPELIEDAHRRGDLMALNAFLASDAVFVPLAADDPRGAIESADRLVDSLSSEHYTAHDYYRLVATVKADLYARDGASAWERIDREWRKLRMAGLLSLEGIAITLRYSRACAALACAARGGSASHSPARLKRIAAAEAAWLRRSKLVNGAPLAQCVQAGLAVLGSDRAAAAVALEHAHAGFEGAEMALYAAACRLHLARLGAAEESESLRWMQEQGVRNPAALAATVVPGPVLSPAST